jgi:type IV secretion system protein VirD4
MLARLALRLAVLPWVALALVVGVLVAAHAFPLLVLGILALAVWGRKRVRLTGDQFGSARWATFRECERAGVLDRPGLLVGQIVAPSRFEANEPGLLLQTLHRKPVWVGVTNFTHACVFAGAGKGKSTSLIIPYLLTCPDNGVVIDIKGELALATADERRAMAHQVVILDPYRQCSDGFDTLNPLDLIDPDSPYALDDVRAMAEALVVRTGEENELHWNDAAEMNVAAILAFVASFREAESRDLQFVSEILSSRVKRERAIAAMKGSGAWAGLLAQEADRIEAFEGKELSSTLTTTSRFLRFLATPAVVESTTVSSFDPRRLTTGAMTIYLVIPPDRLATLQGLLRLWITCLLRVITQGGLKNGQKIRFVLDEAAALGRLDVLETAIAQLRGYGLSCLFCYQSMGQLKRCFREGQDQTFISNMDVQVYFGTNDLVTAEYLEKRLGDATVANRSASGGVSSNRTEAGTYSASRGDNDGWNDSLVGRPLMKKDEILGLPDRRAIVFAPGLRPLMTTLSRSYDPDFSPPAWPTRADRRRTTTQCLRLACISVLAAGAAAGVLLWQAERLWKEGYGGVRGVPAQGLGPGQSRPTAVPRGGDGRGLPGWQGGFMEQNRPSVPGSAVHPRAGGSGVADQPDHHGGAARPGR